MKILEEFNCIAERFDGDIAYVTLRTPEGEELWGECPVEKLTSHGIRERRRFKLRTVETSDGVKIEMEAISDKELSEEDIQKIREETERMLGETNGY